MDYEALIIDGPEAGRIISSYPIGIIRCAFDKHGKKGISGNMVMFTTETCSESPTHKDGKIRRYTYYPLFRKGKFVLSSKMSRVTSIVSNRNEGEVDFWDGSEISLTKTNN